MADNFEQKQRAANLRLLSAMTGNQRPQSQPAPAAPNYSAIPLDPPQPPRMTGFGSGIANALELFGFGKPAASAAQAPGAGQSVTVKATPPALPPFVQPGDVANAYMPPMGAQAQSPAPAPSPAPMPAAPQGANAAYQPPPVDTFADLGGYGGMPRMQSWQEQYSHLNPTPSLEEIFRREYAANPGAFGKVG